MDCGRGRWTVSGDGAMMREFVLTGKTGTELGPQPPNLIRVGDTAKPPELCDGGTGGPRRKNIPGDSGACRGDGNRSHRDGSTRAERPRSRSFWIDHAASDPIGSMAHSGRADLRSVANPPEILEPTVIEVGKRAFNSIQWMRPPSLLPPSLLYE